jgi:acetoacetyl-CoA synthetase
MAQAVGSTPTSPSTSSTRGPAPEPIWTPSPEVVERARLTDFARWLAVRGVRTRDYRQLWDWSVSDLSVFWRCLASYFDVPFASPGGEALADDRMPGAVWFPGARLNYVDQVFAGRDPAAVAIIAAGEDGDRAELTWGELSARTAAFAATLDRIGVRAGDRVVGYLPDVPEAIVAFLGTAAVGAIWSCTGQDYAPPGALDRFAQLEPVVLVVADGYRHGGRVHDRRDAAAAVRAGLPTVRATVHVSRAGLRAKLADGDLTWDDATAAPSPSTPGGPDGPSGTDDAAPRLAPVAVPFDHPLWVLFSSGTTGLPKGIVHGHGGVVLEHLKSMALHLDVGPDDTHLWYTSPSWMMWNFRNAGLLAGARIVTYDGSPMQPAPDRLWALAEELGITVLGTSPAYLLANAKAGIVPREAHDLSRLRTLGVTGSTCPADTYHWVHDAVGAHVQLASITGGTDVVSAFAGSAPTLPVWPGEISAPCLGVALDAFDPDGAPVRGEVGELVVTRPMPSMPVAFWNDPDGERYRSAYFDVYPGVWRHGDWISISEHGGVEMHGRSDSTLNRNGVRMGSADIYQAVERVPEVLESLVIGAELPGGGYWMPLFVTLAPGTELDDDLRGRITTAIREHASPRHVPDVILLAPGIPHTRTGKKLEIPVKRIVQGRDPADVVDVRSVDEPDLLSWYAAHAHDGEPAPPPA